MTKVNKYRVHVQGGMLKDQDVYFSSLKKAKEYMKEHYYTANKWGATLFTLTNMEASEQINTRTTIVNL